MKKEYAYDVELTYFCDTGEYHSKEILFTHRGRLIPIWDDIKKQLAKGRAKNMKNYTGKFYHISLWIVNFKGLKQLPHLIPNVSNPKYVEKEEIDIWKD